MGPRLKQLLEMTRPYNTLVNYYEHINSEKQLVTLYQALHPSSVRLLS